MVEEMNMENWKGSGPGFQLTMKQIIMMHINRCVINGSVEWHGGYMDEKVVGSGSGSQITRKYIPNSRSVFCNSIRMLRIILLSYFDEDIKPKDKKIMEDVNTLEDSKGKKERDEYYGEKINLHIDMFEQLVLLGKRNNFFEEEEIEQVI